jgi:hypothetical protein
MGSLLEGWRSAIVVATGKVFVTAALGIQNRLAARSVMVARMAVLNPNATGV